MRQNVGPLDRISRIIIGFTLIGGRYFFQFKGFWADLAVIVGAVWIWEGLLGYCLFYGILGWSTKRKTAFNPGKRS